MTNYPDASESFPPDLPQDRPTPQSKWPVVIGVISACYGGLFLCCGAVGLVYKGLRQDAALREQIVSRLPSWHQPIATILDLSHLLLLVLLLIGGITLIRRMAVSRKLHLLYACLDILFLCLNLAMIPPVLSAMPEKVSGVDVRSTTVGTLSCMMVVMLAYPVFLLVWFLRGKIRDEVKTWPSGSR